MKCRDLIYKQCVSCSSVEEKATKQKRPDISITCLVMLMRRRMIVSQRGAAVGKPKTEVYWPIFQYDVFIKFCKTKFSANFHEFFLKVRFFFCGMRTLNPTNM